MTRWIAFMFGVGTGIGMMIAATMVDDYRAEMRDRREAASIERYRRLSVQRL